MPRRKIFGERVKHEAIAKREVIVSTGSINSPKLLELSGIGDPEILNKFSIDVKQELPGVGRNLRDHYSPRMRFTITEKGATFNDNARGWRLAAEAIKYAATGKGFLQCALHLSECTLKHVKGWHLPMRQ